jgi:hypothetical protein
VIGGTDRSGQCQLARRQPVLDFGGALGLFLLLSCLFLRWRTLLQPDRILLPGGEATLAVQFDLVLSHL